MADRRMFSLTVTDSLRFLQMPPRARLLYYDLGMHADNDGVVQAYSVLMATDASRGDLTTLVDAGFLFPLCEENLLFYITDWHMNNRLSSRYRHGNHYELLCACLGEPDDEPPPEDDEKNPLK